MRVALAVGLGLLALALGAVLSGSPLTVIGTNSVPVNEQLGEVSTGTKLCQPSGTLPAGTSAIRLSLAADAGPRLTVKVLAASHVVTHGEREAGWGVQDTVTVPVGQVVRTVTNTSLCYTVGRGVGPVQIQGSAVPVAVGTEGVHRLVGMIRIEYLQAGNSSWWSLAPSVARHMGFGHAASGTWIVFALALAMIAITILASGLVLRDVGEPPQTPAQPPTKPSQRTTTPWARGVAAWARPALPTMLRRIPRAAWICAVIACLSAACWSFLTPPFEGPDEPSHFAYVQQLAETGTLPTSGSFVFSEEERVARLDLRQNQVLGYPAQPVETAAQQRRLQHDLNRPLARTGNGAAGVAATQPPLYYALQAIPYWLGSGGTLLDRLELMRLLSALMAGVTALFAYLFVREALPGEPWAWAVGGLGVALAPLLGMMSGLVSPDSMLAAVSATIFYCLARAFRRGLTPRLAIAVGTLSAIGFLTKNNFVGLAPGVVLGLIVLALRGARTSRSTAYRSFALAIAIGASPVCVYIIVNLLSNHRGLGLASTALQLTGKRGSIFHEISYIWQLFLPRLPGMGNDFPGISATRQIWFDRSVGLYGWLDTPFPIWVYNVALIPAALIAISGMRALVVGRVALRRRLTELAVYATMGVGLLALVGADSFLEFPGQAGSYGEPRYLLPLIVLLGAILALGARGAGRRWGPAVGTLIVVMFLAHNLFSQLQVIARFYG